MQTTKRPGAYAASAQTSSFSRSPLPARTTDRITPQRMRALDARIDRAHQHAEQTLAEIMALRRK